MVRNQFYTCFLLIYFLFGLILYDVLSIQFIDEVLVLILLLYTIVYALKTRKRNHKETICFFMVCIFYLLYSFSIGITSIKANLYDFQQQIKPYLAFYCTLYLSPTFTKKQICVMRRCIILLSVLVVSIICLGLSTFFFGGPLAALATTALTLSLYYYFFSFSERAVIKKRSLLIMSLGLLSYKAKFFSEYLIAIYLFLWRKTKIKLLSLNFIGSLILCIALILFVIWDKFDFYFISGLQEDNGLARPLLYKTSFDVLKDYFPFGSGLGTFGNEASKIFYSPLFYQYNLDSIWGLTPEEPDFVADCFYPTLTQFGVVGIFLFILFWRKRYLQIKKSLCKRTYLTGMMVIVILLLESIADSSYLSNRGVLFFILLAFAINNRVHTVSKNL